MAKYFNVTVTPTITASKQHAGAFTAQDVLFDWTSFEIPRGGARLINATLITRPKANATPTKNDFGAFMVFSSSDSTSLGTINSSADSRPNNNLIGMCEFETTNSYINAYPSSNLASTGRASNNANQHPSVIFQTTAAQTTRHGVGFDKYYIAGLCNGAWDYRSSFQIADADIDTSSPGTTLVTDDGSGGGTTDLREVFLPGDVLHAHDDAVIGTIDTITNATTLELTSAIETSVLEDDDYVYNINPLRIILSFELG
tara:strand:+ start:41 stop:811 length:771 start_codon:yes stop_codon:yes gene_type:complete